MRSHFLKTIKLKVMKPTLVSLIGFVKNLYTKPLRPVIIQKVTLLKEEQIQVKIKKSHRFFEETVWKPIRSKTNHKITKKQSNFLN